MNWELITNTIAILAAASGLIVWVTYNTYGSDEKGVERERRQTRFEAWEKLSDELPEIQRQIEKSFRKLLGQGG